jgi:hypothetical protein
MRGGCQHHDSAPGAGGAIMNLQGPRSSNRVDPGGIERSDSHAVVRRLARSRQTERGPQLQPLLSAPVSRLKPWRSAA